MILLLEFITYCVLVGVVLAIFWVNFFNRRWKRKNKELNLFLQKTKVPRDILETGKKSEV